MSGHVLFLSAPGLRPGDVGDATLMPNLNRLMADGGRRDLVPTFPCVTSTVQASMLTGVGPDRHGVIGNGYYWRDRGQVELWVAPNQVIESPQLWEAMAKRGPGATSAVWHAQNIKGAAADFIVTPAPIHKPDGTTQLWCYSKPDGLYEELLADLGHFPLQHYWGPLSNIESSRWIVEAALWLHRKRAPTFQYVYLPHLDYAAQKDGPDSAAAVAAVREFDTLLGHFVSEMNGLPGGAEATWIVAGEYALTSVRDPIFPNRLLREAGLASVGVEGDGEVLDVAGSAAFAVVDHQFAHVYVKDTATIERAAEVFRDVDGVATVAVGRDRAALGIDHERSGEIVLVSQADRWFAYYWWIDESAAPAFARTVDIHGKPGYDPVELFFDPATRGIPLDASRVKGSHGAPVEGDDPRTTILASRRGVLPDEKAVIRDTDVYGILRSVLAP